ncbi:MAG TPA: DUF2325 domain-containing protein [Ramlibacter sp.]|uniref:DUF2325 domain-containing protein n=1 Tax=Ramlibacter sp. TaxID=1917967 RepID=UPI002C785D44|nr:DUF2325 domain-containing protein [Ramlibacter sp.]HVZ44476.1 DUF2325 domain-containing protein [Ramlibacter sp.]
MCQQEDALPVQAAHGSRRRRLWELPHHALCPVIGVCLPLVTLRRLAGKVLGGPPVADNYDLHCGVIAESRQRTRMSEALQRELETRYALAIRAASVNKSAEALAGWWRERCSGGDVGGALWATLTHPRCDPALEESLLRDIHMLQHQIGTANRASIQRLDELMEENAVLARELAAAQRRATDAAAEQQRRSETMQSDIIRLRAQLIRRDTELAAQAEELRVLEEAVPALKERAELVRSLERQTLRVHELERCVLRGRHEAERAHARAEAAQRALQDLREASRPHPADAGLPRLDDRSVLCVGGRQASVPAYRRLIEAVGARFLHHDGGEEESATQLDAMLDSADLVICQTGCISHDAYWRVKDHCKRTGKRCVFVEKPSRAGLQRALGTLSSASPPRHVIPIAAEPAPR